MNDLENEFNLPSTEVKTKEEAEYDADAELAREKIVGALNIASEALAKCAKLAEQTESARLFEVTGQLVKEVLQSSEAIMTYHERKKLNSLGNETPEEEKGEEVFIGSTKDILRRIKEAEAGIIDIQPEPVLEPKK